MKAFCRFSSLLGILLLTHSPALLRAQGAATRQVRVNFSTPGALFYVDGVAYETSQVFRWQVGDVHTIRIPRASSLSGTGSSGGPAGNSAVRSRVLYFGVYTVSVEGGQGTPPGAFQDLSSPTSLDYVYRVQVWSFLQGIDFTSDLFHQIRVNTPASGCTPTATGEIPAGACNDVPGFTTIRCADSTTFNATVGDFWCPPGNAEFTAVPAVGYAFRDWSSNPGLPNASSTGSMGSLRFTLNSPLHIQVNFGPGKFYRINTDPRGLDVIIDRSLVRTGSLPESNRSICNEYQSVSNSAGQSIPVGQGGPASATDFCTVWLIGGTRLLSAPELQQDQAGRNLVFDAWSFGGTQNAIFSVAGANLSTDVVTARFLPAAGITFVTQPQINLPLIVNNRTWPAYNFWFGINRDVTFAAPLETIDANGRRWRFRGWSNGGPAAQTLRVTQEMVDKGLYLIAQYEPLNRLTIETNPPGLPITVDGQDCPAPCVVERLAAESVLVAPAPSVTQADVLRLEFDNWSDGGSGARSVPFNVESRRLVANYRQLYRLSALGNPPEGASFSFNPASADSFYALGTQVSITARANNGFRFLRWGGDTAGMFPSTTITIGGPRSVVAELSRVPFLDSAGIKNAAGTGPQDEGPTGKVAPGSLITIYGANLTPKEEIGPRSPQLQSLAEVSVRVGDRFLPLSFASANQINAQLPFDMPLGPSRLTIVRNGQADVSADFELIRNAPGLFGQQGTESDSEPPLALVFRSDGSIVTEAAPARPNEVLSLTGTGLGPFRSILPAGFALPQGFDVTLSDPVEILVGDQSIQPLRVFAMPGFVGFTSIQFRVGPQFPVGQSTNLRVRVNGKDSNSVRLLVR